MSARALRRLHGDSGIPDFGIQNDSDVENEDEAEEDSSSDIAQPVKKGKRNKKKKNANINPFELVSN